MAWNSGDQAAWIVARSVFQELQLTIPEYMKISSLHSSNQLRHALLPLTPRARMSRCRDEVYSALLRDWREAPATLGAQLQPILEEARTRLKHFLLAKEPSALFAILREWSLEVGPQHFKESTGLSLKELSKTKTARSKFLSYSDFHEVAKHIGIVPAELRPPEAWESAPMSAVRKAFRAEALSSCRALSAATFLMLCESAGIPRTIEALRSNDHFQLPWRVARRLHSYEVVPWRDVAAAVSALVSKELVSPAAKKSLQAQWRKDIKTAAETPSFHRQVLSELRVRGISLESIGRALNIQENSTIQNPVDLVRQSIRDGIVFSAAPIGTIAFFAAKNPADVMRLLDLKRDEIRKSLLRRERGSCDPHPLRIERDLWSVGIEVLGSESLRNRIQHTEWRRRGGHGLNSEETERVLAYIRRLGFDKSEAALTRWIETSPKHSARRQIASVMQRFEHFSLQQLFERHGIDPKCSIIAKADPQLVLAALTGDKKHGPGSKERFAVLTLRGQLELPLKHEHDAIGVNSIESASAGFDIAGSDSGEFDDSDLED